MTDVTLEKAAVQSAPAAAQQAPLAYVPVQAPLPKIGGIIPMSLRSVHFVMPGGVDDAANPSGGNAYDRRLCLDLPGFGWQVHKHLVSGSWPRPEADARADLARTLREFPDGTVVLIDGLVACGVPEIIAPEAERLRLVVLVHLPLGDERGIAPEVAAQLDAKEREVLRAVPAVVATSDWAVRRLVSHHGLAPERVHVAAPGADIAPLASGTDGLSRLLCVASVTPARASTGWSRRWPRRRTCRGAACAWAGSGRTRSTSPTCANSSPGMVCRTAWSWRARSPAPTWTPRTPPPT